MLNMSDSEGEEEVAAPVVTSKKAAPARNNKSKPAAKKSTKSSAPSAAGVDPKQDSRKERTNHYAKTFDRNHGTRKREFDRQSGTGRDKSIKKQGGGARNWGKEGEGSEITSAPVEEGEEAAEEVKEEEPDNSMSYEEYLAAQKAKKAAQSDAFKPLQARKVTNSFGKKAAVVNKKRQTKHTAAAV